MQVVFCALREQHKICLGVVLCAEKYKINKFYSVYLKDFKQYITVPTILHNLRLMGVGSENRP